MKTVADLKVGDIVWVADVNRRHYPPYPETVNKIGTKLITAGGRQYRKESLTANDDYGHQTLILDLEDEKRRVLRIKLLKAIENNITGSKAEVEDVRAAAKLLGINLGGIE